MVESSPTNPVMAKSWFDSGAGRTLHAQEQLRVSRVLPDLFGYHIAQIGSFGSAGLLEASRIGHKMVLRIPGGVDAGSGVTLACFPESLPFAADSIDVVVLPHVLEFTPSPHRVLREVERVLIGEGHLVLLGLNPWSLWGLWRFVLGWREDPPWCGQYYALARLRDWLALLDFDLVHVDRFSYRPPLRSIAVMDRLQVLEQLGRYLWPLFAGAYLVIARKRVAPLTPSRLRWPARHGMIAAGVAEPSMRKSSAG